MAADQPLDLLYATRMKNHPYGTALYTPLPFSQFHPGSTGYFSSVGFWNPVIDLSSPSSSSQITLSAAPSRSYLWGPKTSTSTRAIESSIEAGISSLAATVLPFDLGAFYNFVSAKDGGAVLLTNGEVTHERFYYESPFKEWVKAHGEEIVRDHPDLRDYPFWVITSTWSVQDAALNCWREDRKRVGAGFKIGMVGLGECGPSGEFVVNGSDHGWVRAVSKQGENGKVVFFGGLQFRFRKLPFGDALKEDKKQKRYRGDSDNETIERLGQIVLTDMESVEGGERFEIECESVLEAFSEPDAVDGEAEDW